MFTKKSNVLEWDHKLIGFSNKEAEGLFGPRLLYILTCNHRRRPLLVIGEHSGLRHFGVGLNFQTRQLIFYIQSVLKGNVKSTIRFEKACSLAPGNDVIPEAAFWSVGSSSTLLQTIYLTIFSCCPDSSGILKKKLLVLEHFEYHIFPLNTFS